MGTNNDPGVIARYYVDAVRELKGCPERLRSDGGTENTFVAEMQCFLRSEHIDRYSGANSFLRGTSLTNQRIESWWSVLRKQWTQYWMDIFKHLKDDGYFTGDFVDKCIIQFCFLPTIKSELKSVAKTWNLHRIRGTKNAHCPHGKPVVMYTVPGLYNTDDHLKSVTSEPIQMCDEECANIDTSITCEPIMFELCSLIMEEMNLEFPDDKTDLSNLYLALRTEIRRELVF